MRKTLAGVLLIASIVPFAVSAATAQEIAAQIEALLKQVEALQKQVSAGPGGGQAAPGSGVLQCPMPGRTLRRGVSGADVTRLQQYLALDPAVYPEAQVTGFFGALTEAAVKRFQCKHKLVCDGTPDTTGYGVVGPRTSSLMIVQCPDVMGTSGNTDTVSGFMRITPTAGAAPLNVKVDLILNAAKSCKAQTYEVFFGDATSVASVTVPANFCNELTHTLTHVYTAAGTYSISLRSGVFQDKVNITVTGASGGGGGGTQSSAFNASPKSGAVPLNVTFTGTRNPDNQCGVGTYTLDFGDGQSTVFPDSGCASATFTVTHGYTNAGTYVAKLFRTAVPSQASSISISAGGSGGGSAGGAFSATPGIDGNAKKVSATFELSSSCARYDIDWGDGTTHDTQSQGTCAAGTISKSVTHTYQNTGSYTITLKRGANLESTATIGVTLASY